jgi:hypothetical protein
MSYRTRFRVHAVLEHDEYESQVELEAASGARIRATVDTCDFDIAEGDIIDGKLEPVDITTNQPDAFDAFDAFFRANPHCEYRCERVGEWGCIFGGMVVALTGTTATLDCGGIYVPLHNLTHDERVVGEWVQFTAARVDLMGSRPIPSSRD